MVSKKVTATSKVFMFSDFFDKKALSEHISRAEVLNTTISDIPMLPQQASDMDSEIVAQAITGTAAIEGNPYSEQDIKDVINKKEVKNYSINHEIEVENLISAYKILDDFQHEGEHFIITEDFIKELHHSLTKGLTYKGNTPGFYRDRLIKVGSEQRWRHLQTAILSERHRASYGFIHRVDQL